MENKQNSLVFKQKPKPLPQSLKDLDKYGNNSAKYKTVSFNYTNIVEVSSPEELVNFGLFELERCIRNTSFRLELSFKNVSNSLILQEFLTLSELKPNLVLNGGELLTPYFDHEAEREFDQSVCQFSIKDGKMVILV